MSTERSPSGLPFPAIKATKKILIVEDHHDARQMLAYALGKLGFEVISTASGSAALSVVRAKKPMVVLLDIGLADGQTGLQVCEKIKAGKAEGAPYVIITSGRKDKETVDEAEQQGANAYLVKPFRLSRLVEIISTAHAAQGRFILELRP